MQQLNDLDYFLGYFIKVVIIINSILISEIKKLLENYIYK